MNGRAYFLTAAAALAALSAGCGGSGSSASGPTGTRDGDVPFEQLGAAAQKEYMQVVVVPVMGKVLKASPEPQHFVKVTCETCHGKSARRGNFEMPSEDLPKLASFEQALQDHPNMTRYMADKVVPEMAKLLKQPVFDPSTGTGFGCFDCHQRKH